MRDSLPRAKICPILAQKHHWFDIGSAGLQVGAVTARNRWYTLHSCRAGSRPSRSLHVNRAPAGCRSEFIRTSSVKPGKRNPCANEFASTRAPLCSVVGSNSFEQVRKSRANEARVQMNSHLPERRLAQSADPGCEQDCPCKEQPGPADCSCDCTACRVAENGPERVLSGS